MLPLGLLILAMFAIQAALSVMQMRTFPGSSSNCAAGDGGPACGFHAGAIVRFLIDGDGVILEEKQLFGVTCFARVRDFPGFEEKRMGSLSEEDLPKVGLRKAILDARNSYHEFISGEANPDPPSSFQRALTGKL